jgi:hypothetical protein
MSNVIRFLEKMGSEAQWDGVTKDKLELALVDAKVEDLLHRAILDKDSAQLQVLMQQKSPIGFVSPAEEPSEEEEEESEEGPGQMDARRSSSASSAYQF